MRGAVLLNVGLLTLAAAACGSSSDTTTNPAATTVASTTKVDSTTTPATTTTAPYDRESKATPWRPLDNSGRWQAALTALRASPNPADGLERMLSILRADRELPSEQITGRVVDGEGGEAVIWVEWRGYGDDSVGGTDLKVRATAGPEGVVIVDAETRSICRRGVGTDLRSCL